MPDIQMKKYLENQATKVCRILYLKHGFIIHYKEKVTWGKRKHPCHGKYEWDSAHKIHNIQIEIADRFTMETTIYHELIHAWQSELDIKLNHGKLFRWWTKILNMT